jgi:peptide-methionine (R)-S-oxide reductase
MLTWNDVIQLATKGNLKPTREINHTEEEWKRLLTAEQYYITRQKGTERPFSGELCHAHSPGRYRCICCDELLFDSIEKFESHSGWPSFTQPAHAQAIQYVKDSSHGMIRVEVLCNVCKAHLGHVFQDGPPPSGLRYCINSVSIRLEEQKLS